MYYDYFLKLFIKLLKRYWYFLVLGILKRTFLVISFLYERLVQPWFTLFYYDIIFAISFNQMNSYFCPILVVSIWDSQISKNKLYSRQWMFAQLFVFRVKIRFLASSNQKLPVGKLDSKHQSATASWCDNYTEVNFENWNWSNCRKKSIKIPKKIVVYSN